MAMRGTRAAVASGGIAMAALGFAACRSAAVGAEDRENAELLAPTMTSLAEAQARLAELVASQGQPLATLAPTAPTVATLPPTTAGQTAPSCQRPAAAVEALAVAEDQGFLAVGAQLMRFVSPPPPDLSPTSCVSFANRITAIHFAGGRVFVGTEGGLEIVGVGEAAALTRLGGMTLAAPVERITSEGEMVYLVTEADSLHLVDVSDPAEPLEVGFWNFSYAASYLGLLPRGRFLVLVNPHPPLQVIDLSDPQAPVVVASQYFDTPPGRLDGLAIGRRATLMVFGFFEAEGGSLLFDVSDPLSLHSYRTDFTSSGAMAVDTEGDTAYLTGGGGDLIILRLLGDGETETIARFEPGSSLFGDGLLTGRTDVQVGSGIAYVVANSGEMLAIDVTDPSAPRPIASLGGGR
jgi:hypothetical protein